jgi:hypothetical protein
MSSIDELFGGDPFSSSKEDEELFWAAMQTELEHHIRLNRAYDKFLSSSGWRKTDGIDRLPAIPVSAFKYAPELTRVTQENGFTLASSGTSGRRSQIFVDPETSRRQKVALNSVVRNFLGPERRHVVVFDVNPADSGAIGARQAAVVGYVRSSLSTVFLAEEVDGALSLKPGWAEELASSHDEPVLIVGFTYVIYQMLQQADFGENATGLPEGTKILHIGGWKKLQDQSISQENFKSFLTDKLGVPGKDIHDVYGFTELMGVNFFECAFGWKHAPKWVRVRAKSQRDLASLEYGEEGLLEFTSPIAHSYAGLKILTDDVGIVQSSSVDCGCGRSGQRILVTGRRTRAEIRGCGDILAARTLRPAAPTRSESEVEMLFPADGLISIGDLSTRISDLKHQQIALAKMPHSEVLRVLSLLREAWRKIEAEDLSGLLRRNGLGYLIEWSHPDRLRNLLDSQVDGGRVALDRWVLGAGEGSSQIRAFPRGLVSQWISGNVPVLGIFPIIYSWLTGNAIISRVSSQGDDLTSALLAPLARLALADTVAKNMLGAVMLCTFDRQNELAHKTLARNADVLVGWGGSEAIEAISSLPTKPETRKLLFGPRTSFAVVYGSVIDSPQKIKTVARRLVADSVVFEQAACASPHSVFLITDEETLTRSFGEALAEEFSSQIGALHNQDMADDLRLEIAIYRRRRMLDAEVICCGDEATVVISDSVSALPEPIFGRTLHLVSMRSPEGIVPLLTDQVQSVGVVGKKRELTELADLLGARGVKRFPTIGKMTNFEEPWDGESIVRALVRVSTLGGP